MGSNIEALHGELVHSGQAHAFLPLKCQMACIIIIIIIIITAIEFHSVAVVLTLVQTKQIRINIHKGNNTKNTLQTTKTQ